MNASMYFSIYFCGSFVVFGFGEGFLATKNVVVTLKKFNKVGSVIPFIALCKRNRFCAFHEPRAALKFVVLSKNLLPA